MFQKQLPKVRLESMRSSIKILVIDDEPFLKKEKLRNVGYKITETTDIASIDFVENFEIIVCDIKGVGTQFDSSFQGAFLIDEIKKQYPDKYVILYTGQVLDSSYNQFTKLCDNSIQKDSTVDDWKKMLDEAISIYTDPEEKLKLYKKILFDKNIDTKQIKLFEKNYRKSFRKNDVSFVSKMINSVAAESFLKIVLETITFINMILKILG